MSEAEFAGPLPERRVCVQIDSLNAPDGTPVWLDAFTTGARWNRFATPWFNTEMADCLVRTFNARRRSRNGRGPRARYDAWRDAYIFIDDDLENGEEVFAGQELRGEVLYPIGAWSWSWSAVGDFED